MVSMAEDLGALPRACSLAVAGFGYLSPSLARMLGDHLSGTSKDRPSWFGLTAREVQILRLLADGQSPAEISSALHIRLRTVKYNLSTIYRKLGARGAVQAIVLAYKAGLVA
jgi:DNA-binding NarL/FixJ family response regulator